MKGRVKHNQVSYHPKFGELKPGQIVELPATFDFSKSDLFEPARKPDGKGGPPRGSGKKGER